MDTKKDEKSKVKCDNKQLDAVKYDDSSANWRSLFNFTSTKHTINLTAAVLLSMASGIIIPALAVFLGKLFDVFTSYGGKHTSKSDLVKEVSANGIGLVALGCASGVLNATYFMSWLIFGELQAKTAREKLFDGLLDKNMGWYDTQKAGLETLMSRLQTYVYNAPLLIADADARERRIRELHMATSQPLGFLMQYTVTIVAALGLAFYYSWSLTLVTLGTIPISAIILSLISKWMQPAVEAQVKELTEASKLATNAISAIETVKCFNGQEFELSQYARSVREAAQFYLVQARSNALQIGFVRLAILGMFVQGFWYGSHLVNIGQKTPGDILTCFWACLMATQTVEQIMPQIMVLEKGRAAGAILDTVISRMEEDKGGSKTIGRTAPQYCEGDIEVRNVSFSYPSKPDQFALKSSSFFFAAGETTFVVGKSGSGKSTLSNLLMRFYDPRAGEILIDGNRIQAIDVNWIRNNITLVQQESILFNETIFSNIVCGRQDQSAIDQGEVEQAIDMAFLQHTIRKMPQGLDTMVGAGGNAMSGGQRQRVALARARLRNTPILILDEATSALDRVTKSVVVERIRSWRAGKTTIIITHDMSQVRSDDYVYVLNQGIIVQEGFRHSLEEVCATGPYGGLKKSTSRPLPPMITKPCNNEAITTVESSLILSASPHDSMDVETRPRSRRFSGLYSPTMAGLQVQRASMGFTSPSSPVAFPLHRVSFASPTPIPETPEYPFSSLLRPPIEGSGASPRFVNYKDIEMQPFVRHPGDSKLGRYSTQTQALSTASTLINEVSRHKCKVIKVGKAAKEAEVARLKGIFLTIWPNLPIQKRLFLIVGFIAALLHAAATPVFSYFFSQLLSTFYLPDASARSQQSLIYSLSILGIAAIDSSASYLMHYLLENCGQQWIDTLRTRAYRNILDQPMAFFSLDENSTEKLTETLDRNAEETRNLLGRFAAFVFVAVTIMIIAITWSLILSWRLTLVGLASAPFLYVLTQGFEYVSGRWEARSNAAASATNAIFVETFSNIRTVRALTLEAHFHKKYTKSITSAFHIGLQRAIYSGIFFGLSDTGIVFVTALIFYYGAHLVSTGTQSVTEILTVFTTLLFSIANVNAIVAFIPQINSSRSTATSLLRLASLPYNASHESTGPHRPRSITSIQFDNTTFAYPFRPTAPILRSLNLSLDTSSSTALVGASGSGKSTIASLLLHLYPASSGTILINSLPLSAIHTPTLRSLISIVPQHPTLFPASIAANISYPSLPSSTTTTTGGAILIHPALSRPPPPLQHAHPQPDPRAPPAPKTGPVHARPRQRMGGFRAGTGAGRITKSKETRLSCCCCCCCCRRACGE